MTVADSIVVSRRFCGPTGSGNGGYVCGLVAGAIDGPAAVRLHAPTPLDKPLRLEGHGLRARLFDGEKLLAEAHQLGSAIVIDPPPRPTEAEIEEARPYFPTPDQHMAPECFVCGNARDPAGAMCVFPGRHPDTGRAIARWSPAADLVETDRLVASRYLWAALDCPSYFTFGMHDRMALLGSMSAETIRRPAAGEPLTVTGWTLGHEGRKHRSASVIHDADGHAIAIAEALWIDVGAVNA